ncbi:MAG: BatD family protein [Gemmatimonadaceae bacterium]|nr:BatD family protein [Gemmatimonadaceae bacterium]
MGAAVSAPGRRAALRLTAICAVLCVFGVAGANAQQRQRARRAAPPRPLASNAVQQTPAQASNQAPAQAPAPAGGTDARPAIVTQGRVDPRQDVNFSAVAVPAKVYVGQQVTYQIGVFLSEDVSQRLRRNPEFVPPDVRSMLAYDLPSPAAPLSREEGGRHFDVHVFQRALFPLTPGRHTLAPARLTYSLPLSNTFFSREETHSARTSALTIEAREPPTDGRPRDFSGAVGRLSVSARVDTPTSRVGDPVTLTVSVRGAGNVSLFPRPAVSLPWGDAVNGGERVAIDSGVTLIQGRKDFDWVVTPRREGRLEIPALRYPYWNPYTERYEVAVTTPLDLSVGGGTLAARPPTVADTAPRLPLRLAYRGAVAPPLSQSPVLWAVLALVPMPALVLGLRQRPRRARAVLPNSPLQRLAAGSTTPAPSDVRRAFAAAVAARTAIGATAMTDSRTFVRALRRAGVTTETAQRTQLVLGELDRATYGGESAHDGLLLQRALDTYAAVDAEAIPIGGASLARFHSTGRRISSATVLLAGMWMSTVAVAAADDALDAARFQRGVAFYDHGDYVASMHEFRDIVTRVPRAADAWANLGTAAWYAEDTATAAIGWQRALRLEPLALDVRTRLEATPGFESGLLGDVPPIPVDAAAALGALLWIAGWGGLAFSGRGAGREWRGQAYTAIGIGALVGVLTVALAESLAGRHRVVVTQSSRLRAAPALGAEEASEVMTGESATETTAQGVWTRVRFADGRSGWLETSRLGSLDVNRAP